MLSSIDLTTLIVTFLTCGGLTALVLLPQKKKGAKIDNAQKICDEYADLLGQYKERDAAQEQRIKELSNLLGEQRLRYQEQLKQIQESYDQQVADLRKKYEGKVAELEKTIEEMQKEIDTLKKNQPSAVKTVKKAPVRKTTHDGDLSK